MKLNTSSLSNGVFSGLIALTLSHVAIAQTVPVSNLEELYGAVTT